MGQFGDVRVAEDFELRLRPAFTQCANRRQRANEIPNCSAPNDEDAWSFHDGVLFRDYRGRDCTASPPPAILSLFVSHDDEEIWATHLIWSRFSMTLRQAAAVSLATSGPFGARNGVVMPVWRSQCFWATGYWLSE